MAERYINFQLSLQGGAHPNLLKSIFEVRHASSEFIRKWKANLIKDANDVSQKAFKSLDHIQNELLRHRDADKENKDSAFKEALSNTVGYLYENVTPEHKNWFSALEQGKGSMPEEWLRSFQQGENPPQLTLETALNKLKHRDTTILNFSVEEDQHTLYVLTNGGMGKKDSISKIDVLDFCEKCKAAATHIIQSGRCCE